jgi:hypothetical protein
MVLRSAFSLCGFALIFLSTLFQAFSIEFYDSASGWRGGEEQEGVALRFHLAGLASHSFLFGLCFAILGVSLLVCQVRFWIGSVATILLLFAVVAMTEIERELWARKKGTSVNQSPRSFSRTDNRSLHEPLAHALWRERGCPAGSPQEDWFRAEQEIKEQRTAEIV